MSRHLDIYTETKPATKIPRVILWPLIVIAFPFVLITTIVWLPVLLLKKRDPLPNKTPCGNMCVHSYWRGDKWRCAANQGYPTDWARKSFVTKKDPNNCSMFKRNPEYDDIRQQRVHDE